MQGLVQPTTTLQIFVFGRILKVGHNLVEFMARLAAVLGLRGQKPLLVLTQNTERTEKV